MVTERFTIDTSHSGIHFTVRHMVIAKVRGAFTRFSGALEFDAEHPESSRVSANIEAASIDTREPKRDEHLRSADFFDVAAHPELRFESTRVERTDDGYRVTGDLTIRGVTRSVVLDAEFTGTGKDPWGNRRIGFQAKTAINRKDFGLHWNAALESGGVLVGEKVDIELDVEAIAS
jgi:polyisoprenoid-binding protein YceI